jgi:phosphoglycolate phosphatase
MGKAVRQECGNDRLETMLHIARSLPKEKLKLLVFDLDGTLIDSRADLCASVNATLQHFQRPRLPEDVIASFIGDGASMLVRRSLGDPADEAFVEEAVDYFLDYYRDHKLDHTYVYEGVFEVLARLRSGPAYQMAVLSNKPVGPSREICEALALKPYFFQVYGGNSFPTKKPDPQGLQVLMEEAGVHPEETLMIGDTDVDILTARAGGAWALGCKFGLSPHTLEYARPDCLVDEPRDWVAALL